MIDNSMPKNHLAWSNARQMKISTGGDSSAGREGGNSSAASIASPSNIIMQIEERTRHQKPPCGFVQLNFPTKDGIKSPTSESRPKDESHSKSMHIPGICTTNSQDSNHTTNSIASRRQRIMALSAKNKARWASDKANATSSSKACDTETDVDYVEATNKNNEKVLGTTKSPSWQSPCSKNNTRLPRPEPIETQYSIPSNSINSSRAFNVIHQSVKDFSSRSESTLYQPEEMKNYNDKGPKCSDRRFSSPKNNGISDKINIFQRDFGTNLPSNNRRASLPPEVNKAFSSPKYQPRHSIAGTKPIESKYMHKNMSKPIQKEGDDEVKKSQEKEAYGAIIETPKRSSVSKLHAMFDSRNDSPLMPMNCTNSSVRHSIPLPSPRTPSSARSGGVASRYRSLAGRGNMRHSFDEYANSNDDRSVSSVRSSSSNNFSWNHGVAIWSQKNQTETTNEHKQDHVISNPTSYDVKNRHHLQSNSVSKDDKSWIASDTHTNINTISFTENKEFKPSKLNSAWQKRCVPQPIETDRKGSIHEKEVENSVTDTTLDSLANVIPTNTQMPNTSMEQSNNVKPWENDTKHSIVQSWLTHSSKPQDSTPAQANETEDIEASGVSPRAQKTGDSVMKSRNSNTQSETLSIVSSRDSFIEEKKSGDLSFDENEILGEDVDGCLSSDKITSGESSQHSDQSNHLRKMPFYDDDSYLSHCDTDTRGLAASESVKNGSVRSRTTYNSEDMSLYVEDEQMISEKEDEIFSAQFEQINIEVSVEGELETRAEETTVSDPKAEAMIEETEAALTIDINPNVSTNLHRINPSPKDCDEYRNEYRNNFDESGCIVGKVSKKTAPSSTTTDVGNQVFDIWATTSNEERDDAIKFDETEEWLNRDPVVEDSVGADEIEDSVGADEKSVPSQQENADGNCVEEAQKFSSESGPILIKKPPQSFRSLEKQKQRAKVLNRAKKETQQPKQEVFDPFGIDVKENVGLTVEITDDLFSSNPDPFTNADSFSPVEWSSPKSSNTTSGNMNTDPQHIGYYNSPDSRIEI